MTDLDELLEAAYQQARRVLLGRLDEQLVATWVLVNADGASVIVTPFDGPGEKDLAVMYMRQYMRDTNVIAYSFLTEAWVAVVPRDTTLDDMPLPSEAPNREEVVMAQACNATQTKSRTWNIKRDKRGRVTALVRDRQFDDGVAMGRFDNLLAIAIMH